MSSWTWRSSVRVGTVPSTNSSVTFLVVYGPGRSPLNASTSADLIPAGRLKSVTGVPALISVRMRDQSGAEESRDRLPLFGVASELPIQTPTASAGATGSSGGARKPYARTSLLSDVVPVL